MSKVSIELDLKVVQDAIHAKVAPVVDEILAGVDIPALIKEALLKKPDREDFYLPMMGYRRPQAPVDDLVDAAVADAARTYVKNAIEGERAKLEAAFSKMLQNSSSKIAKTMVKALTDGMDGDWRFAIDTKITPTVPDYD